MHRISCMLVAGLLSASCGLALEENEGHDQAPQHNAQSRAELTSTLVLSPSSLAFCDQPVGTTSAPQFLTLHNGTQETLFFVYGLNPPFVIERPSTFELPPGSSLELAVRFKPTSAGTFTSNVLIYADSVNGSGNVYNYEIPISGTGTNPE
ncbi:hypothetical protein [Archangium violaceum]|uniref:hypothetical protein n=1 Tax=Archangium violaceum TaxID=83451 RepID=UPI0037BE45E1